MTSFLSGTVVAIVLAVGTYIAMTTLYVPTEQRYAGDNLALTEEMMEDTVASE